jgi:NAD+ synthase (glutamine-hydrolysing)
MKFKIALAQINPILGDIEKNREKHIEFIERAIKENSDLIVFPELSLTGYKLNDLSMEVALKPEDNFFEPIKSLGNHIDIAFGFVERGKDKNIYNSAMFIENGAIKNVYRKIYLPTHGMFQELRFMGRGKKVEVFDTKIGRVSMLICRDIFHPSLLFLAYAQKADFVLGMSNMPLRGLAGEKPGIQSMVENALYSYSNFFAEFIVFVNRVGFEDGMGFYGGSMISTPSGGKEAFAGILDENFTTATVDTEDIYRRRQSFPLLREEDLYIIKANLDRIVEEKNG